MKSIDRPATATSDAPGRETPRIWLVLSDKKGDNGQVEAIARALPWPWEHKNIEMLPPFVLGKPPVRASLEHIDQAQSDPLGPPWPDLVITIGRRCSNVALWLRERSGGHTRVILVGKPSGRTDDFDLIIHTAEAQLPPLPNVMSIGLPLMEVSEEAVKAAADSWRSRLAQLPHPLIAVFLGGPTGPFVFDGRVTKRLVELANQIIVEQGGTAYFVTSRRTPGKAIEDLKSQLPASSQLFQWTADAGDNPYRALLGLADGFIVTGDSISMIVEVVRLRKPLAILDLPTSGLGSLDQLRRSFARWMFAPLGRRRISGRLRQRLAVMLFRLGLLGHTRDFRAFHKGLIEQGLVVRAGEPLVLSRAPLPNDLPQVVSRIKTLLGE